MPKANKTMMYSNPWKEPVLVLTVLRQIQGHLLKGLVHSNFLIFVRGSNSQPPHTVVPLASQFQGSFLL